MPVDLAHRGLWKLMMKLPTLRGKLQLLFAQSTTLVSLCAAYDEASATLEQLRKERSTANQEMIAEYDDICSEIEAEVADICVSIRSEVPE